MSRRKLLQYAGAGCALVLLGDELDAAGKLRRYQVRDAVALPRFASGDLVVADTSLTRFAGDGLYLYPAWGMPRLYEVRAAADFLEFRNPGTGQLLWTQSAAFDSAFAGMARAAMPAAMAASHPELRVPLLPARA